MAKRKDGDPTRTGANPPGEVVAVEIQAELRQIKSMADGTFNVLLNVPEWQIEQVKVMLGWLKDEIHVMVEKSI